MCVECLRAGSANTFEIRTRIGAMNRGRLVPTRWVFRVAKRLGAPMLRRFEGAPAAKPGLNPNQSGPADGARTPLATRPRDCRVD